MASIQKRDDGKWRARCRDPDGREKAKHFTRRVGAQRWLDETTAALVTGQYVAPDAGKTTFREYAEMWRAAQVHRPTTAEKVESLLRLHAYPVFGDRPLSSILPSQIQAWAKGLNLAPASIAVIHGVVAGVFKAAVADRRIVASPCAGTKLPKVAHDEVVPLLPETVAALAEALPPHLRALVTCAAATGLRQGEALG